MRKKYSIKQCFYIINNIHKLHKEEHFNELLPSWYQALIDCLEVLNNEKEKTIIVLNYISIVHYLLDNMPVIELHKLEI